MKKIIVIILLLITLIIIWSDENYNINNNEIRFRVIANSNNIEDIIMKEKVVKELSNIVFINSDREKIKKNILNNLSTIESRINTIFEKNNYNKTYNVMYGLNEFPQKEYKGKIYKEGLYESLVIEIGDAKGNNYWCFLYPSLCMSDYENNYSNDDSQLSKNGKVKIKFKIFDIFRDIFM